MQYVYKKHLNMDERTLLDANMVFEPSDDRPAGEWMEGYWRQAVPWAKRFALAIWACATLLIYMTSRMFEALDTLRFFVALLGISLVYSPVVGLGYFSFRFGDDLEKALASEEQMLLERAFRQLHRALLLGITVAGLWLLREVAIYYIFEMREQNELLQSQY